MEFGVFFVVVIEESRDIWALFRFKNEPRFYVEEKSSS